MLVDVVGQCSDLPHTVVVPCTPYIERVQRSTTLYWRLTMSMCVFTFSSDTRMVEGLTVSVDTRMVEGLTVSVEFCEHVGNRTNILNGTYMKS